jgi:hypothetical protein
MANKAEEKRGRKPGSFTPGKVEVVDIGGLEIDWSVVNGREGIYKSRLEDLMAEPDGKALLVEKTGSGRTQLNKRARELGVKVKFGWFNGQLYCRIVKGAAATESPVVTAAKLDSKEALILSELKRGTMTALGLSKVLGVTPVQCRTEVEKLELAGRVEFIESEHAYRLKA